MADETLCDNLLLATPNAHINKDR